jgi:peptide chain release factor subunit 1
MSAANDVTEETLRSLVEMRATGEEVLSLYLDLDPGRFATPRARTAEIDSLLDQAHRAIEAGERPHAERLGLRATLQRARGILGADHSWARGARALAVFVSEPLGLSRTLRLPHPVTTAAVVSDMPFIAPLTEVSSSGRVCVALVDERFARVLRGSVEQLHEVSSFGDPVHGRHEKGGWSQARYQRSQHEDVEHHLAHVGRVLHDLLKVAAYDRLLIACTEPLWPRVLGKLHPDVRALLGEERISLDVGDAAIEDVVHAVEPVLAAEQRAREDAVLAELRESQGRAGDERSAAGLGAVLLALVERRVRTLLYEVGFPAPGVLCARCGWMGPEGESCPVDGGSVERRENILEDAVRSAVSQSAEILPLRERPELGPLGGIAAMLRF